MNRLTISCATCRQAWTFGLTVSYYEQEALEARPCPHCGACTLSVHDNADWLAVRPRSAMQRARVARPKPEHVISA